MKAKISNIEEFSGIFIYKISKSAWHFSILASISLLLYLIALNLEVGLYWVFFLGNQIFRSSDIFEYFIVFIFCTYFLYLFIYLPFEIIKISQTSKLLNDKGYRNFRAKDIITIDKLFKFSELSYLPSREEIAIIPGCSQNNVNRLIEVFKLYQTYLKK